MFTLLDLIEEVMGIVMWEFWLNTKHVTIKHDMDLSRFITTILKIKVLKEFALKTLNNFFSDECCAHRDMIDCGV